MLRAMTDRDHVELVTTFYEAFQRHDGATMARCYADDARFSDPVFTDLRGAEVGAMWRMLTERGKDLELTFRDVVAEGGRARAHWEARYTFSGTGRKVYNVIDAELEIRDGKIVRHVDTFDLWRWMRMALGPTGVLLGWLPPVQSSLRKKARAGLEAYMAGR